MSEPSSNTSGTPLAFFDPESVCLRTSQGTLLSEAPELLQRLPDWGTTSDGVLYEHQTPERLTAARDGSALLGTPMTPLDQPQNLENAIARLLPTPAARDYKDVGENTDYEKIAAKSKLAGVAHLLPTPTARDFRDRGPHAGFTTREKCQSAVDRGFAHLPRVVALLPTPTTVDSKVLGPKHTASVLMVKQWLDGDESSDGPHPTQQTTEGCDPDSSNG
jgi:hypothetical protein